MRGEGEVELRGKVMGEREGKEKRAEGERGCKREKVRYKRA